MDPNEVFHKTYIAPKVLKNLLNGEFDKIGSRAKALGFVNILERELHLDLSELREMIQNYYDTHQEEPIQQKTQEPISKEESTSSLKYFVGVVVLLVLIGAYWGYAKFGTTKKSVHSIQKSSEEVHSTQSSVSSKEDNMSATAPVLKTNESNASEENISQPSVQESNESNESTNSEKIASFKPPSIVLIPKKKLWVGIIYLDNYKKKVYITDSPIELNTSRDQLIVTGHGLFELGIDNNITDYKKRHKVRFLYRAGEIEEIDAKTFKEYNRGKNW